MTYGLGFDPLPNPSIEGNAHQGTSASTKVVRDSPGSSGAVFDADGSEIDPRPVPTRLWAKHHIHSRLVDCRAP